MSLDRLGTFFCLQIDYTGSTRASDEVACPRCQAGRDREPAQGALTKRIAPNAKPHDRAQYGYRLLRFTQCALRHYFCCAAGASNTPHIKSNCDDLFSTAGMGLPLGL